jgi:hypothetical protein
MKRECWSSKEQAGQANRADPKRVERRDNNIAGAEPRRGVPQDPGI